MFEGKQADNNNISRDICIFFVNLYNRIAINVMTQVWISAAGLSLASIIGALPGFIIKALPHKITIHYSGFYAYWPD